MRSNSPLLAAACCSLHVRTYNVCQVSVCWHARSAALRLHGAFSPVSTTILLRWGLGPGVCFLAACLRSAVAGLQRSQRDSSSAAFADPDGPARARPIFLQSAAAPTPSAHFLLFGPAPPDMPGQKKKKKTRAPRIHLHFFVFASSLFPFFFCYTIEKENDLGNRFS